MSRTIRRPTALLIPVAIVALVLLASCGGGGSAQIAGAATSAAPAAAAPGELKSLPGASPGTGGSANDLIIDQQQIVKTGEVTIQVASVTDSLSRVRAMAVELGGYVGGSQAGTLDQSATLTLRIPAARFDDALAQLAQIGSKVLVEATREEDVTAMVVDLNARVKNFQASAEQYRRFMGRAKSIEDILAVQSRLDDVQRQIDELSAQLKSVSNQAKLSTLTVTLQPKPQPVKTAESSWDPGEIAGQALGALLQIGQALGSAAIWLGIVGLPLIVTIGLLALILTRLGLLRRPVVTREV
jgi:hypothetical protein